MYWPNDKQKVKQLGNIQIKYQSQVTNENLLINNFILTSNTKVGSIKHKLLIT